MSNYYLQLLNCGPPQENMIITNRIAYIDRTATIKTSISVSFIFFHHINRFTFVAYLILTVFLMLTELSLS